MNPARFRLDPEDGARKLRPLCAAGAGTLARAPDMRLTRLRAGRRRKPLATEPAGDEDRVKSARRQARAGQKGAANARRSLMVILLREIAAR